MSVDRFRTGVYCDGDRCGVLVSTRSDLVRHAGPQDRHYCGYCDRSKPRTRGALKGCRMCEKTTRNGDRICPGCKR